jgi:hypothetical protein
MDGFENIFFSHMYVHVDTQLYFFKKISNLNI